MNPAWCLPFFHLLIHLIRTGYFWISFRIPLSYTAPLRRAELNVGITGSDIGCSGSYHRYPGGGNHGAANEGDRADGYKNTGRGYSSAAAGDRGAAHDSKEPGHQCRAMPHDAPGSKRLEVKCYLYFTILLTG